MSHPRLSKRPAARRVAVALAYALLLTLAPALPAAQEGGTTQIPVIAPGSAYRQTNLVSDWPGVAAVQDPLLVNPWGISLTANSPFWVANNGSSTSTLYRETSALPLVKNPALTGISIPPTSPPPGGLPTGTVANTGGPNDFFVTSGTASARASFLFATLRGNIVGWSPNVPAAGSNNGVVMASRPGSVYTGLAIASNSGNTFLYAADFANGRIDVYNGSFVLQPQASFPFADPTVPATNANNRYHPFNIQAIGSSLYVAYAKVGNDGRDEEGVGNGYVRRFSAAGVRDPAFAINNGALNAPWGITLASPNFGVFSNALLVGNFGRGNPSIHAYRGSDGLFLGTLQDESGNGIFIDELWDLKFGNGGNGGHPNRLYFSAGIGDEQHGLFGSLAPTTASATSLVQFSSDDIAVSEGAGHVDITVTRAGDASNAAAVNFATFDETRAGRASQKSDYQSALGRLTFAAGETSKTFRILLVDDTFAEGDETIELILSNPTGTGVGLGSPNVVALKITDNDAVTLPSNPIDTTSFFVRQHYLDFLNREPDAPGLAFWSNQINACGGNQSCVRQQRVLVSAAFFLSIENQETGVLDILTHQAAYGTRPLYGQFLRGTQALQRNVVFGQPGAAEQLEANKAAYFNEFVTRPEFVNRYPSTQTNEQFVDALLTSAALTPAQVRLFVVQMTNNQEVPPAVPTSSSGGARPVSSGTARLQFNQAQTSMTLTATVNNIDFTGAQSPAEANDNLTNAHIHAGPNVAPGVNGPVVWGFIGTPFNDNNPNDSRVTPFASGVGANVSAKWDAPEGQNTTLAAQLANIREGRSYINFHTTQFGGGEIRGNIPAASAFRDSLVAGLNNNTLTRAQVLRRVAEQEELKQREFNAAFVLMEYFGYLRRDPDPGGFDFWLGKLNQFGGDFLRAEMVRAFIESIEYRQRFGQ